jgi:uncharacterized protein YjcR
MSTEIHYLKITEILKRVGDVIGEHKNEAIAKALGVSPTTASNWKTRNTIPWMELWEFSCKRGIDFSALVSGKGAGNGHRETAGQDVGSVGETEEEKYFMEKYEKLIQHFESIIEQQARQIEFLQNLIKDGPRKGDPDDIHPERLRKGYPS